MASNTNSSTEVKRVGKFGLVGVVNTLIDFIIYNSELKYFRITPELAKVVSSTAAMIFSFFANKTAVFENKDKAVGGQALKFLVVTGINLYVIQVAVIHVIKGSFLVSLADRVALSLHLTGVFSPDFMAKNVPFFSAILIGLVWNYFWYKRVVFKS